MAPSRVVMRGWGELSEAHMDTSFVCGPREAAVTRVTEVANRVPHDSQLFGPQTHFFPRDVGCGNEHFEWSAMWAGATPARFGGVGPATALGRAIERQARVGGVHYALCCVGR